MEESECRECLAENVRRMSKRRRISIERLADFADLSQGTLWKILAAKHNATLRTIVKLANALDCEPNELLRPASRPAEIGLLASSKISFFQGHPRTHGEASVATKDQKHRVHQGARDRVAQNVQRIMLSKSISKRQLGAALRSRSHADDLCDGVRGVTVDSIGIVADFLGVDMSELLAPVEPSSLGT